MNDKQRLEQARKEYDEFLAKLHHLKVSDQLSVEAQWDLSITMFKLMRTLGSRFNKKKFLVVVHKCKAREPKYECPICAKPKCRPGRCKECADNW